MTFQIVAVFLTIFIVCFGAYAAGLYAYTGIFIRVTEEYVDAQLQAQAGRDCEEVLNSISNSVTAKFELERQ